MAQTNHKLEHLDWAIKSRAQNQRSCLALLTLFENDSEFWKEKKAARAAQDLVAVAFSLWRAAFLAEKTGKRADVFAHGRDFLAKLIEDNAISYVQDKNSKEWTFNYYTKNARSSLTLLNKYWNEVPSYEGKTRAARERWDYCQSLLDVAINNFELTLGSRKAQKDKRAEARTVREGAKRRRAKVREITLSQRSPKTTA